MNYLAEVSGKLYAIGGKGSGGTVEVYDSEKEEWKLVKELEVAGKYKNDEYSCDVLMRIV